MLLVVVGKKIFWKCDYAIERIMSDILVGIAICEWLALKYFWLRKLCVKYYGNILYSPNMIPSHWDPNILGLGRDQMFNEK